MGKRTAPVYFLKSIINPQTWCWQSTIHTYQFLWFIHCISRRYLIGIMRPKKKKKIHQKIAPYYYVNKYILLALYPGLPAFFQHFTIFCVKHWKTWGGLDTRLNFVVELLLTFVCQTLWQWRIFVLPFPNHNFLFVVVFPNPSKDDADRRWSV